MPLQLEKALANARAGENPLPGNLLLSPLRPRLLPFPCFPSQLLGMGLIALLGGARFLIYVVMVAPRVGGSLAAKQNACQEAKS